MLNICAISKASGTVVMLITRFGKPVSPFGVPEINIAQRLSSDDAVLVQWIEKGEGIACERGCREFLTSPHLAVPGLPVLGQVNAPGTKHEVSLRVLVAMSTELDELYKLHQMA
jgi:hypothetical protein